MEKKQPEIRVEKAKALSRPTGANWVRFTDYPDGSRSWSYYRLKREAKAGENQIGQTHWDSL